MSAPRVKICGLSTNDAVLTAAEVGASFIGFVFFPASPRNVTPVQASRLAALAPEIPAVAVTVNPTDDDLRTIFSEFRPTYLQLHGHETPQRTAEIKERFQLPIIKAFSLRQKEDVDNVQAYDACADFFLFDAKAPNAPLPGGNGIAFDWTLLAGKSFTRPWFLSGGLNADNVEEAVRVTGASMLDISSGVESSPGVKSTELIHNFMMKTQRCTA